MPRRRSKGADIIKKSTCFFLCCLYLNCSSCKIFLEWLLLINREPNVKAQVLLILKSENKIFFSRGFFANRLPVDFLWGFNFANLAKICENRENLSRKQFLSLRYKIIHGTAPVVLHDQNPSRLFQNFKILCII